MHDMPNVPAEMKLRMERYRQLRERHIPVLFPQGVDIALDSPEPVAELLASEDYVSRCREANEANAELYETAQWTPAVLATGMLPDGRLLVDALCESWLRHLHGYRLYDWQESAAQMRHAISRDAADFQPVKIVEGTCERQSYTAWLNVYLFPSAIRKLRREHEHNSRMVYLDDEEDSEAILEPFHESCFAEAADESRVRELLAEAIRNFRWTRRTRSWFRRVCAPGESMRTVSQRSRVECSTVSRAFAPLRRDILRRIRRAFPDGRKLGSHQSGDFILLIRRMFSETELDKLTQ